MRRAVVGRKRGSLIREKISADDPKAVERAIDQIGDQLDVVAESMMLDAGDPVDVDLVNGTKQLDHGLGRPVRFVFWVAKTAGAPAPGFDPAQPNNPHPSRQVWITCTAAGRYRLILL